MSIVLLIDILKLFFSILLISVGIIIQFIPNMESTFLKLTEKLPILRLLASRPVQLVVGFILVGAGLRFF